MKNLEIFSQLCGHRTTGKVVIVTTMWSEIREETGARREQELKADFWKLLCDEGCRTERFQDTRNSAWQVLGGLSDTQCDFSSQKEASDKVSFSKKQRFFFRGQAKLSEPFYYLTFDLLTKCCST